MFPGLINFRDVTSAVIHQNHEPFQGWCSGASDVTLHECSAVTLGNNFHVFQAVFLPLPPNEDMVSHPVNAWKTWRVAQSLGYIAAATSWTGMYLKVCATLHVFHAFTGYEPYYHLGKEARRLPGNTWKVFPEVTALLFMQGDIKSSTTSSFGTVHDFDVWPH